MSTETEQGVELFLQSWWSKTYNRPLKDPMLKEYTVFELMYEYYDKQERELAAELLVELEDDRIEEEKEQDTLDWIEEEERKEREAAEVKQKEADEQWMIEQLKKEHGDDFGDDINMDFSE